MATNGRGYFDDLAERFGNGWNRFWFTPGDAYPLGVLRCCVGLLALYFQLSFTPDLVRFFGDGGLLPTQLTEQWNGGQGSFNPGALSYLTYLHTSQALYTAHIIGAVVLMMMTVGVLSRVTTVLGFVVVLSYINRAPMIATQVESILSMLMFYLCFAPTGASWSVDRWICALKARKRGETGTRVPQRFLSATIVLRLIQVNLAIACLMMGLAKIQGPASLYSVSEEGWHDPWGTGVAVWDMIARPYSPWLNLMWLRQWPYVINAWTHAIVLFELLFPIFIWNRVARPLLLGIAVLVWGSLALISGIAPFYVGLLIGCVAYFSPDYLRRITGGQPQTV